MPQKNNIEERIEQTLNSFDGMQRAAPQPFFYTRLRAKMEQAEKSVWESVSSFISRPVMMFATVCIILLFNGVILYKNHIASAKAPTAEQLEQTVNDAFDVASNTNTTLYSIWDK